MGNVGSQSARLSFPRFFVDPVRVGSDRIDLAPDQWRQIQKVLRLRDGDRIIVCDGTGDEIITTVRSNHDSIWAEPVERRPGHARPRRAVWLYQSALRGDRFTWLLQKGTEIGVEGFVPVRFRYTQEADYVAKHERFNAVVREAAEQSERATLPTLVPAVPFEQALTHNDAHSPARFLLDEREQSLHLRDALADAQEMVCLFIGPEGGISDTERQAALARGVRPVSLGPSILRSETAGLVAATISLQLSGDIG